MVEFNPEVYTSIAMFTILLVLFIRTRPMLKKIAKALKSDQERDDKIMRKVIKITPTKVVKEAMEQDKSRKHKSIKRWLLKNYPEEIKDKLNK